MPAYNRASQVEIEMQLDLIFILSQWSKMSQVFGPRFFRSVVSLGTQLMVDG